MARPLLLASLLLAVPGARGEGGNASPGGTADEQADRTSVNALEAPGVARASITELREQPTAHLGDRVRFVLQLKGEIVSWNPYATRFGSGDFARFEGWCDQRFTWNVADFHDPARHFFARRRSVVDFVLHGAAPYQRYEAIGTVREVFLGEPWIELETVQRLPESVSEGTILHAARALALREEGRFTLALEQFERARAGSLPAPALAELERLSADCRRRRDAPRHRRSSRP